MEWYEKKVEEDGKPHTCEKPLCPICRIFGTTEKAWQYGPTRLVVRDSYLNDDWKRKTMTISKNLLLTEEKVENSINRLEGKAISPRTLERVPAGAIFDFEMSYKIMEINGDENTDEENLKKVFIAMKLVELDTLGGSGSRGYGKIKFTNLKKVINNNEEDVTLPEDIFEKDKK
jgi:CRISPR-associated protein Csm3